MSIAMTIQILRRKLQNTKLGKFQSEPMKMKCKFRENITLTTITSMTMQHCSYGHLARNLQVCKTPKTQTTRT